MTLIILKYKSEHIYIIHSKNKRIKFEPYVLELVLIAQLEATLLDHCSWHDVHRLKK